MNNSQIIPVFYVVDLGQDYGHFQGKAFLSNF